MVRLEPWQHVPEARMAALYAAERDAWRRTLSWDTSTTWNALDAARRDGRAGGMVACDGEAVAGWTYWVPRGSEVHCGALVASASTAVEALTDAVLRAAEAHAATRLVLFTCAPPPALPDVLRARGFVLDAYDYLVRPLDHGPGHVTALGATRGWDLRDLDPTAALFKASYAADERRPFAGQGRDEDWRGYTRELVLTDGCGRFRVSLSRAAAGGGRLDGVALVTDLGEGTAHLAQLAVRPEARGHGLARRLLTEAIDGARRAGFARMTLLVSRTNVAANALYLGEGFAPAATFLAATRAMGAVSRGDRRATPDPAAA